MIIECDLNLRGRDASKKAPLRCGGQDWGINDEQAALPVASNEKRTCRLHGGASGSGGPPGERNGQYRHGDQTKAAIAERQKFSALLKMLRSGLT